MGLKNEFAHRQVVDDWSSDSGDHDTNVDGILQLKPEPFPVNTLPDRFRQLAESISVAVGVDVSFAVLPMFSAISTAIGNSRYVSTKDGNHQPLMLWTAVVGVSGSQKSEPYYHAEEPMRELDGEVIKQWQTALAEHEVAKQMYKVQFADWKKSLDGQPPVEPRAPAKARLLLSDFSYESMVENHAGSPRGILISCEELSAFFGSFERYSGSGSVSSEQGRYLQAYDGRSITSDRVSSWRYVPRPFINISGTIQPGILQRCFTDESRQNGLASRLWLTYPEPVPIRWSDKTVSQAAKRDYRDLIRELWELRPANDTGWPEPSVLPLHPAAQKLFGEFMDSTGLDAFGMFDDCRAAAVKFIVRCARIAGVLHCCQQVNGNVIDHWEIQPETIADAIEISQWSLTETFRIYQLLKEPEETRELRQIANWLRQKGGITTARDLCRNRRDIETTEQAELILMRLQKAGFGSWRSIHKSREFVLKGQLSTNPT